VGSIRSAAVRVADVHATPVKVHLVVLGYGLWSGDGRGEGRAGRGVVVGGVEGGGHGLLVEHVGVEGVVAHEGRADRREAREVLLVGAGGMYDGVVVHGEGVYAEGGLGL